MKRAGHADRTEDRQRAGAVAGEHDPGVRGLHLVAVDVDDVALADLGDKPDGGGVPREQTTVTLAVEQAVEPAAANR